MKDRIESHFKYFWENHRLAVLEQRKTYFETIPYKIQQHVMCKFLFEDIITMNTFRSFFKCGREFDPNFIYEISFGFMPRQFKNTAEDRYMYEEEGDVTEVYFILKGDWALGFNSYMRPHDIFLAEIDDELQGP